MKVFHRTSAVNAAAILRDGFRDGRGRFMTNKRFSGCWVSDRPLSMHANPDAVLLTLEIPEALFVEFEWVQEDLGYRESLIPAEKLNAHGRPVVTDSEE